MRNICKNGSENINERDRYIGRYQNTWENNSKINLTGIGIRK
jgi:hypothetical protein